jgi:bile acid-coenzyme A ligase
VAEGVSYGRRLTELAEERRADPALVFAADDGTEPVLSWEELERRANQVARLLASRGVAAGDLVVVGLGNTPDHVFSTFGAWKLGASVLRCAPACRHGSGTECWASLRPGW